MKRLICLLVLFCLLLSGCSSIGERIKEPVRFYYIRQDFREDMGSVIVPEIREASGHRYDLAYLLALYSTGPASSELVSPFPRNTLVLPVEHSEEGLVLNLILENQELSDAEYTLASACLAMTCMELIHAEQVTVNCGDRSVTMRPDNLMLEGTLTQKSPEEAK